MKYQIQYTAYFRKDAFLDVDADSEDEALEMLEEECENDAGFADMVYVQLEVENVKAVD